MSKIILTSLLLLSTLFCSFGQSPDFRFEHITKADGLSNSIINDVCRDSRGFLWIATNDGLNRYDGLRFVVYRPNSVDTANILDNQINVICEDNKANLLIGTRRGLNIYDPRTESFFCITHSRSDSTSLSNNYITSLFQDSKGKIWVGTKNGLNEYIPESNTFKYFGNKMLSSTDSIPVVVNCVYEDNYGDLWIGTSGGLYLMNPEISSFKLFCRNQNDSTGLVHNNVISLHEDEFHILWIGTTGGLNSLDSERKIFSYYALLQKNSAIDKSISAITQDIDLNLWVASSNGLFLYNRYIDNFDATLNNSSDKYSISGNNVSVIYQDDSDIMWFGTRGRGLNKLDKHKRKFKTYTNFTYKGTVSNNYFVSSVLEDKKGHIWIGTQNNGLFKHTIFDSSYKNYLKTDTSSGLADNSISSIIELANDEIWVGTNSGISIYNPSDDTFKPFLLNDNSNGIGKPTVNTLIQDSQGNIWLGTNSGLSKIFANNQKIITYKANNADTTSLSDENILCIIETEPGILWVGTEFGLNKFEINNEIFRQIFHEKTLANAITVTALAHDKNGNIWCGTQGNGITQFSSNGDTIKSYRQQDGLPENNIQGLIIDNQNNLWASTTNGLCKIILDNDSIICYDLSDGLTSLEFIRGAYNYGATGELYFGSLDGFVSFKPDEIKQNQYIPSIVITNVLINNKEFIVSQKSGSKNSIPFTNRLNLLYTENSLTFEFASLHLSSPENNVLMYKLENFDVDWHIADNKTNQAKYTNLSPGNYVFKVKGTNSDGVWCQKEASMVVKINSPFWSTWWFVLSLVIIAFLVSFGLISRWIANVEKDKVDLKKQIEERKIEIVEKTRTLENQKHEILEKSKQLEISNNELRELSIVARETNNAIAIMDGTGNYTWINQSFTNIFGVTLNQLADSAVVYFDKKIDELHKIKIKECNDKKQTINYEFNTTNSAGNNIWIQVTLTPIADDDGSIIKIIAVHSDITKPKVADDEIKRKSAELSLQTETLQQTNEMFRRERERTTSSIKYAHSIQQAMLPLKSYIEVFYQTFIIYKPKDIVSGDFYWFTNIPSNGLNPDKKIIAVVDCTGHGVPGAFMSMIGNRLLSEIVNEKKMTSPKEILNLLDIGVSKALRQTTTNNNDGMDICLCAIEEQEDGMLKLTYSGAKRPLLYYEKGSTRIKKLRPDRRSIGGLRPRTEIIPFTNKVITVNEGTILYLMTDGLVDQNAPDRQRFTSQRLISVLQANLSKNLEEQKDAIENALSMHQKDEPQRDDITMIGVKL